MITLLAILFMAIFLASAIGGWKAVCYYLLAFVVLFMFDNDN